VAIGVNTEHQPSNREEAKVRSAIAMVATMNRSLVMKTILLAGAAALALSTASAFAAGPNTATDSSAAFGQPSPTYGTGGYVFPDDGAPSGDLASPLTEPQQQPTQTGRFSHVYLYPPAQDGGAD
jgi:hypothetical protein